MPKESKISSKPQRPPKPDRPKDGGYSCTRCQRAPVTAQRMYFSASKSALYRGNNGFLSICKNCVDELFEEYKAVVGEKEAVHRLCMKLDFYWNEAVYDGLDTYVGGNADVAITAIRKYINRINKTIGQGQGLKTYDDTLDEAEALRLREEAAAELEPPVVLNPELTIDDIDTAIVEEWGEGYKPSQYRRFEARKKYWMSSFQDQSSIPPNELGIVRQIVLTEVRIDDTHQSNERNADLIRTLDGLVGSLNLKPSKMKQVEDQTQSSLPFGLAIKITEDEEPIPEPDPEFDDVDNIVRYISVWFLGHLCKMFNIKNSYSRMYESEIAKYRVERPELDMEEDSEEFFQSIFGDENANKTPDDDSGESEGGGDSDGKED